VSVRRGNYGHHCVSSIVRNEWYSVTRQSLCRAKTWPIFVCFSRRQSYHDRSQKRTAGTSRNSPSILLMHNRFRTSHRKVIAGELLILPDFAPAEALDPADWLEEQGREHMQREPAGLPARGGSIPTYQGILLSLCGIPGRQSRISPLNKFVRMRSPLITILSKNSAWRARKNCTKFKAKHDHLAACRT
jgi:hypothetical protein